MAGRGVSNQPQFETKDGCVVPGSVSTAAILRGKLVLTSGALPWRCRTRVSKISCAAARAPRCCLGLDVRVWCSEVTQNQPWFLCVQHLVGTWQDNLALMGSLRTVRLDFFAGSVLAAHGAREMNAEARSLAHAVFFTVEGHFVCETSNGRLAGTVGGNDDPHRERGPGWAHCLGKRRFGPAFRRQTAEFGEKVLYMPTEECDCRLASGFLLCVSWYSLGARSFLRLPEAEPNDPSLLLSPWSSLGPVVLHAQLPPDPVGPAPVPRRVYRACSWLHRSTDRVGWYPC